jgi:hypothetical protein
MSNRRYLEIDSTYRNRNQFNNPSNFTVLIAQSGTRDAIHAYDPVSTAAPIKTWTPDNLILAGGVVDTSILQPLNTPGEFTICFPNASQASHEPGYYVGYPIQIANPVPIETVKITSWNLLSTDPSTTGLDCFNVTVNPSFSSTPDGAVTFIINATNLDIGSIFIPGGFIATNYYVGYIMYNETLNQWRPIISYDGTNKVAGLDLSSTYGGPIVGNPNPLDNWTTGHVYSIREDLPKYFGTLPGPLTGTSNTFFVDPDTIVSVGDFIRFTGPDVSYRVTEYDVDTNLITVSYNSDGNVDPGATFEVLQFTRDNAVPFCYTGSLVSQQEMVCYEIELINLILPNKTLTTGGRIAFYPHVYVELQNVSGASAGTKCVIYSNNPNAKRMLFRAAIDDIPNPVISPFVKIDGDGMVQTVKFKPNDNFKFGVYLPNGDPLETVDSDQLSPIPPDPLLQVSALFSMRRL